MTTTVSAPPRPINRPLAEVDPEIAAVLDRELARQREGIELIASENFTSRAVLAAMGSVLTNKYAEGYPGRRYYGGCVNVDEGESLAISRAKALFSPENPDAVHANVQPHSGSQANAAVYMACLKPGETLLGMSLSHGGHLTHGHPLNVSGKLYHVVAYGVTKETERIDYDELLKIAEQEKPKLIVAGASAYPRTLDFPAFRKVADAVGALLMVDMAHIAGLIATGLHPSPVGHAHFVTTTTHKTLRGPRAGLILYDAGVGQGDRQGGLPRPAGGPARAHHRGEGRRAEGGGGAGVPDLPAAGRRERARLRRRRRVARLPDRLGRHRQPPLPRRRREEGADGKGRRKSARRGRNHGEQEHDPLRPESADGDVGPPDRDPRRHDPGNGAEGDDDDRGVDGRGPRGTGGRGGPAEGSRKGPRTRGFFPALLVFGGCDDRHRPGDAGFAPPAPP